MTSLEAQKTILVGLGIVVRNGLILICKRHKTDSFGGLWEFPGGKCEAGETPDVCVRRELLEEVALHVTPTTPLEPISHTYSTVRVALFPFLCRYESGEAVAKSASELQWVEPARLKDFRFPPANAALLETLASARIVDGAIDLRSKEA
jgi:mutator protein MutT